MVTGSLAAGYYGQPRMTRDVDLVVELAPDDPARIETLLGDAFLVSAESARAAMVHQTMFNAIHREAFVKVDFVIRKSAPFRVEEFGRRRRVDLDGHTVWMVSAEDLILAKLVWASGSGSDVQLRDIRGVIAARRERLDWGYIEKWAATLGVRRSGRRAVMNDTPPDVDAAFSAMFATLTPSERVRMMSEMFDTARRILISGIRAEQPDISDTELKVQIFLRTYRDDYSPAERDRIVDAIRAGLMG